MKTIIGIDPDIVKSGLAVIRDNKIIHLESFNFVDLINAVSQVHYGKDGLVIKIENPEAIRPLFGVKTKNKRAIREKICQDVGKCKATARLICEVLESKGYIVNKIKPLTGPTKKKAKADAEYFNKITGWQGRSNEDKRDAALIALFG